MLNPQQNKKLLQKLETAYSVFDSYIFTQIHTLPFLMYQTKEHFRSVPPDALFTAPVATWGGEGATAWFKADYTPDAALDGKALYVMPKVGGYEGFLWVNGAPCGTFATKIVVTRHGNHYCDLLCKKADSKKALTIALEFYAGHYVMGCQPFETNKNNGFFFPSGTINVCVKNQNVADFLYDLRILLQLAQCESVDAFRRAAVLNALFSVHQVLLYSPQQVTQEAWFASLQAARDVMQPVLAKRNGDSAPTAWVLGHSHMDTAWLWPVQETIRKNARTIANQLSLMEQFPDYRFLQSASCHTQMMEQHYPAIFEGIKEKIAQGRYEPNGAVWVECDCNLTGGEAMVRQFLWGQRYTQEKFGYLSDCFWLPDTFGYSAAIPQIMKGFGVSYFLTTKLAWNDTNPFPYETFVWEGIDKSQVLSHFFVMDTWTDPKELSERIYGNGYADCLHNKQTGDDRLIAFGYGDGGGGPQFEMIELANRLHDVEGCPKTEYTSASAFMDRIAQKQSELPVYKGELYLELHRGTFTAKQQIKKNNRTAEMLLHNIEFMTVLKAFFDETPANDAAYRAFWEVLLQNQFHDILPGSCIASAHDEAIDAVSKLITDAVALQQACGEGLAMRVTLPCQYSVCNTTSFARKDVLYLKENSHLHDTSGTLCTQQIVTRDGETLLAVSGVVQRPYSVTPLTLQAGIGEQALAHTPENQFIKHDSSLETPFYIVQFTHDGFFSSLIERRTGRELCAAMPLNTFVAAEDVPASWDGWDIDADCFAKLAPCAKLLDSGVVAFGAVEYRIRNTYSICNQSKIEQDIIFYADSPLIAFDTRLTWNEKHQLLKVVFDTTVQTSYATHEIQFGAIKRPTTRNNSIEQAMFEVCNHKYTDLSEPAGGIALLNDCKYGISVEGGKLMLSLAKGGLRPDDRGDAGVYTFRYALLPHAGAYCAKAVTASAYCFNYAPLQISGHVSIASFLSTAHENVIIETVKPCEDAQNACIVRMYEGEGSYTQTKLLFPHGCTAVICDMMEREIAPCDGTLVFAPFEIKTIKIKINEGKK